MNWEGISATRGEETAVSGRAPEINSHTQSCPKMERVVSRRSECRVGGSFQGVAGSPLIRSGMENTHQWQPLLTLRPSGVIKKKLRSQGCVSGLKGYSAASPRVSDALVVSTGRRQMTT